MAKLILLPFCIVLGMKMTKMGGRDFLDQFMAYFDLFLHIGGKKSYFLKEWRF